MLAISAGLPRREYDIETYISVLQKLKIEGKRFMLERMTFNEKLEIIREIFGGQSKWEMSENEILCIEDSLQIVIPEALREFYLMFGNGLAFLKCMYDIIRPKELCVVERILIIAKENQNVCSYGIDTDTQKVIYLDESNHITKIMESDIEDFLIYLLAVQGTEFLPCIGKVSGKFIDKFEKYLFRVSKADGEGAVYCGKNDIICVVVGHDIFISTKNDDAMQKFEEISGLEVDYL